MMLVPETQVSCCLVTGFYVKNTLEPPTNQLQDTELFLKSSCPEGRPATYSTDTGGFYPRVKRSNVNLIYHFHLSTRLRMSGSVPLLSPHQAAVALTETTSHFLTHPVGVAIYSGYY